MSSVTNKNPRLFNNIVRRYTVISTLAIILFFGINQANAIDAGPSVPSSPNTISQYCANGTCSTGGTPSIPVNYTKTTDHIHVLIISLSQTCEILNKNGMPGCPSVKDLIPYDTSNQLVSGHFVKHGSVYIRTAPQMKNNWLAYYYTNKTVVCVECYFDVTATSKSQEIIIQPTSFSYVNKTEIETGNQVYNFDNRFMQGCDVATIGNIPGLLSDTINYMLHGCVSSATNFHTISNHTRTLQPWNYNNPYSTLHQLDYLKNILHGHSSSNTNMTSGGTGPVNCITHQCSFVDPYKKQGY